MINANELRIGSRIRLFLGIGDNGAEYREYIIEGIKLDFGTTCILIDRAWLPLSNNFEGIPLTEDWFEKITEKDFDFVGFGTRIIYQSIQFPAIKYEFTTNKACLYFNDEMINIFEFVHQWQNIHFALTGQELEVSK